jgi:hypothetical protein
MYAKKSNALERKTPTAMLILKFLHQVFPHRPHPRSLAVHVHRDGEEQTAHLKTANGDENFLAAVGFEPLGEEEGEDEAVEDVCHGVNILVSLANSGGMMELTLREIEGDKRLAGVLTITVDGKGDASCTTKTATE